MLFFNKVQSVSAEKVKEMIGNGDVIVIDVRSSEAYEKRHVEGAMLGDKSDWVNFTKKLDKKTEVICYCYKGKSSRAYCKKLMKAGFTNVYNLKGGYDAWLKAA